MRSIVEVNPFDCRMWDLHDRLDHSISEDSCKAEIQSFEKHGQLVPTLGRNLRNDPRHKVELIFGARRLFVARFLNRPLKVELRELSDRDALVAMDIENRLRTDISPYERGVSYLRWLRVGHFRSQDEIARELKVSASQVSRLMRLAQLPSVILNAFNSPAEVLEVWGLDLMAALEDPQRRQPTISKARQIGAQTPRPLPRDTYRMLIAASVTGRKVRPAPHDEVIKSDTGAPLFRIRYQRNTIAIIVPLGHVGAGHLEKIRTEVRAALTGTPDAITAKGAS